MEMECQELINIPIFRENMTTFREASYDSAGREPGYMTDSEIRVVNFDQVKNRYIKGMHLSDTPCSADALYFGEDNKIFLIEFKNGSLGKDKIYKVYNKIYDSLLIFNDIAQQNISFCREHLYFILVYNENRNSREAHRTEQGDSPKAMTRKFVHNRANKKFVRFGLEKFEKIFFREVFTYTESEFRNLF